MQKNKIIKISYDKKKHLKCKLKQLSTISNGNKNYYIHFEFNTIQLVFHIKYNINQIDLITFK